jgi:putative transposase
MAEKKSVGHRVEQKRRLIEPGHQQISIRRQCELVDLNRASYYYQAARESVLNLELMRKIDEQYLKTPFYGWPRMTDYLHKQGYAINHKRVQRLMQLMGLQAIYPRPRPKQERHNHKIYPYLLKGVEIVRPNQVWSSDITYIPLQNGFMYLVAVIDWYSRYILAWELSNTLDGYFCQVALQQALTQGRPEIFNTDQGVQFTATDFTDILAQAHIQISMDGRGRALDNIFIERFWRSLKYEDIYLWDYATVPDLLAGLARYFTFYNLERPHQSLDHCTPAEVHFAQNPVIYVN